MGCGQLQLQRWNGYSNNVKHVNQYNTNMHTLMYGHAMAESWIRYQEGLTAAVYA